MGNDDPVQTSFRTPAVYPGWKDVLIGAGWFESLSLEKMGVLEKILGREEWCVL